MIDGAARLAAKGIVTSEMSEDDITAYVSAEMCASQRSGIAQVLIWDIQCDTQYDPVNPLRKGELDFKFRFTPYDYDNYLAVEAKKLRGSGRTLGGDYVDDGVMDFVEGRYGRNHSHGIMLGYVVVAPIEGAVASVQTALNTRRSRTAEAMAFCQNSSLCQVPHTYQTQHVQVGTGRHIVLVHVFLDFSPSGASQLAGLCQAQAGQRTPVLHTPAPEDGGRYLQQRMDGF